MKKGKRMGWKGKDFVGGILIAEQLFRSLLDKYPPGFPRVRCVSSKNKFQSFEGNALLSPARSNHALIPSHFLLSVRRSTVLSLSLFLSLALFISLCGTGVPLEETGKPTILRQQTAGNKRLCL